MTPDEKLNQLYQRAIRSLHEHATLRLVGPKETLTLKPCSYGARAELLVSYKSSFSAQGFSSYSQAAEAFVFRYAESVGLSGFRLESSTRFERLTRSRVV